MAASTTTLKIPDSLPCNSQIDKAFIWNIKKTNANEKGIWIESAKLKSNINVAAGKKLVCCMS